MPGTANKAFAAILASLMVVTVAAFRLFAWLGVGEPVQTLTFVALITGAVALAARYDAPAGR